MKIYKDEEGNPLAYDGRKIEVGDIINAQIGSVRVVLTTYNENGVLSMKNNQVSAYAETICRGADIVEIINR